MTPKFSIIVPVYNVEAYLAPCLDSLLEQTYDDYRIIVIDDVSKDSSLQIARGYAEKHPDKIHLIEHPVNKGLGGARNTGIEAATGEYLVFLDSDDYLRTDTLAQINDAIERENPDIVEFCYLMVDEQGNSLNRRSYCANSNANPLVRAINTWNKAYRRELFADVRFPERRYYEDYCTTPKLLMNTGSVVSINEPFYMYRQRTGSIIHDTNVERNRDILWGTEDLLQYFRGKELSEEIADGLEYLAIYHVMYHAVLRVNGIDRHNKLQKELVDFVRTNFPDYQNNPYWDVFSAKEKKLLKLIGKEKWGALYVRYHVRNRITGSVKRFLQKLKGK